MRGMAVGTIFSVFLGKFFIKENPPTLAAASVRANPRFGTRHCHTAISVVAKFDMEVAADAARACAARPSTRLCLYRVERAREQ
jgi:hypothetical protein